MIEAVEDCGGSGETDLLQPGLLHELFERQADARPDATALLCAGARMSYGELEAPLQSVSPACSGSAAWGAAIALDYGCRVRWMSWWRCWAL
jgi:non-ribosomal peptide synthetase component F